MKKSILFTIFLFVVTEIYSQTSWIKCPYYEIDYQVPIHDSETVGPMEIVIRSNGLITTLVQANQQRDIYLFTYDSAGNFLTSQQTGHSSAGHYNESCHGLRKANNNGYVYCFRHDAWTLGVEDRVYKIGISGPTWQKVINSPVGIMSTLVVDFVPTLHDTYYLQFTDSLVELDSIGNYIRSTSPFNGKIFPVNDSDFVLSDSSSISRRDFNGNSVWLNACGGLTVFYADSLITYAKSGNLINKFNSSDGSLIWSKVMPHVNISHTSDGGLVAIGNLSGIANDVMKFDSSGVLSWTRTITFPHMGFKAIEEYAPGSFITGGAFQSNAAIGHLSDCFSAFIARLDSNPDNAIDSANIFFNGNANDNNELSFANDACYVAAAIGSFGTPRDSIQRGSIPFKSVFGLPWGSGFASGLDYQFSDCDGNGIIDSTDVSSLTSTSPGFYVSPHWSRSGQGTLPDLIIDYQQDTLFPGDTLDVNVILGSPLSSVDSVYSLSLWLMHNIYSHYSSCIVPQSDFGDTSSNMITFFYPEQNGLLNFAISRTDHINAYVDGDTIARFRLLYIPPTWGAGTGYLHSIFKYNAISMGGFEIQLNPIIDSVYIIVPVNNISEANDSKFFVYPNPADEEIIISSKNTNDVITIYDETGKAMSRLIMTQNNQRISVKNFPAGIYYVSSQSFRKRFAVIHQ